METPQSSQYEKSLLRQLSYRDQALDHIDLTRKRINMYLETHASSPSTKVLLSKLDTQQFMMNKIQPEIQRYAHLARTPCPVVNTQEGCKKREEGVCWYNHDNEGVRCHADKSGKSCRYNKTCYYVHCSPKENSAKIMVQGLLQVASGEESAKPNSNRPCPYVNKPGGCSEETDGTCPYLHTNKDKMCMSILKGQTCRFGDKCAFSHQQAQRSGNVRTAALKPRAAEVAKKPAALNAHSDGDTRSFHDRPKVFPCSNRNCSRGDRCAYLHRPASQTPSSPSNASGRSQQTQSSVASQQGQYHPDSMKKPRVSSRRVTHPRNSSRS